MTHRSATDWAARDGLIPYLGQLADGEVWRAMGTRAQLMIDSPVASQSRLRIRASGYIAPMTLEVRFNGRLLMTAWFPADTPQDLDLGPIWLEPGAGGNELNLHSRQGMRHPGRPGPALLRTQSGCDRLPVHQLRSERIELSE